MDIQLRTINKTRKRCPKGSRKDKKTGLCIDKHGKVLDDGFVQPPQPIIQQTLQPPPAIGMRQPPPAIGMRQPPPAIGMRQPPPAIGMRQPPPAIGMREPLQPPPQIPAPAPIQAPIQAHSIKQRTRKNCPRGSRRDKKTGLCIDTKTGNVVDMPRQTKEPTPPSLNTITDSISEPPSTTFKPFASLTPLTTETPSAVPQPLPRKQKNTKKMS
jgi:hypothetical protein